MTLGQAFTIRFNQLFEKVKKEKNISLYKFLKDNCIPRSTILNIFEGNTKCPTLAIIYQVAYAFNMTYLEFLNDPVFSNEEIEFL